MILELLQLHIFTNNEINYNEKYISKVVNVVADGVRFKVEGQRSE